MNRTQKIKQKLKDNALPALGITAAIGGLFVVSYGTGKAFGERSKLDKRLTTLEGHCTERWIMDDNDFKYLDNQLAQANDAFHRAHNAFLAVRDTLEENGMKVKV